MTYQTTSFFSVVALVVSFFALFMGTPDTDATATETPTESQTETTLTVSTPLPADAFSARVGIADVPYAGKALNTLMARANGTDAVMPSNTLVLPNMQRLAPLAPQQLKYVDSETLWLARCIYSETKRPEEQELVAWVIRNRVETGYRGNRTYRDAVLDRYQFSAFNPGTRTRARYSRLNAYTKSASWQKALRIAHEVRSMPASLRPFSETTRHFYSERSMVGRRAPAWAVGQRPVAPQRDFALDAQRFRFYENIA